MNKPIPKVCKYKIVKGMPSVVEIEVHSLLKKNWQPQDSLFKMKIENKEIVVQVMVLYETNLENPLH